MHSRTARTGADGIELREDLDALDGDGADGGAWRDHPGADVFRTAGWLRVLAAHGFPAPPRVRALRAAGADGLGAVLALRENDDGTLESLSNYYSSLWGPVGALDPVPPELLRRACARLRADRARWPVLRLQPLDAQSPFFAGMLNALRRAGYWADSYFCFGNWYLRVDGRSYEAYAAGLPSPLRHAIARGRRRLDRQGAWDIAVHRTPGPALESALADFAAVYARSWKPAEASPRFIAELARLAAARGWLRLGVLRIAGEPAAAQLWLVKDGKASIYKLAYAQGMERFSAGSVLTAALMREALDADRVAEVDYLTGDDAYKRDWMSHRRERRGIVAFHPGTLAGVRAAGRHWLGRGLRRWKALRAPRPAAP
ncbi:MAG: GNAT family N-acetyltransferase [Xylophilus ampelinus]